MSHYDEDKLLERVHELGVAERERHLEKYAGATVARGRQSDGRGSGARILARGALQCPPRRGRGRGQGVERNSAREVPRGVPGRVPGAARLSRPPAFQSRGQPRHPSLWGRTFEKRRFSRPARLSRVTEVL